MRFLALRVVQILGVSPHKGIFQAIKREIQECFNKFKDEMGFGYYRGQEERKTKEASEKALVELQKDWPELRGLTEGTLKPTKKKLEISLVSLEFPRPAEKFVYIGEDLKNIIFKIKNISSSDLSLEISIRTVLEDDTLIEEIANENISIEVNKAKKTTPLGFNVDLSKYSFDKFYVTCICRDANSGELEGEKKVLIHIGPMVPPLIFKPVLIEARSINFPKERRADFGQKITQIEYSIKNETCVKITARFRLRVMEYPAKQQEIVIYEKDFELKPNGEEEIVCPDLEIEAELYKKVLEGGEKGPVLLRASVVNLDNFFVNFGDNVKTYDKGYKLATCDIIFWINCEAGKGIFDRVDCSWEGGEEEPKSRVEGSTFILNNTHPEFIVIKDGGDPSRRKNYIYEQYCRQALMVILRKVIFDRWPDHPRYPDYKKEIQKEKAIKEDLAKAIFSTLDHRLAVHYK